MKRLKNIINHIIRYLVIWSVAVLVIAVMQSAFYTLTPRSRYFTYFEIVPLRAEVGKPITFKVDREVHYTFPARFADTLHCGQESGHLTKVASRQSTSVLDKPIMRDPDFSNKIQGFAFEGYIPKQPEICQLRSLTVMELPGGVEKSQTIVTDEFQVKE